MIVLPVRIMSRKMTSDHDTDTKSTVAQEMHRCEVRDAIAKFVKGGRKALELYVAKVEQKRGSASAARLRDDARDQYKKGNRGEYGNWL